LQPVRYAIKAGGIMNRVHMAIALLLALPLAACGASSTAPPPLAGAKIGGPFTLVGTDGRTVRDTDFAGKYRLVYFGYTFCPDVCPTDLQRVAAAMKTLEKQDRAKADKIVPIFISVDPERDTPAVVKQFVSAFSPRIVGLTGTPEQVAKAAKEYAISYTKQPAGSGGGYLVDHMAITYLMGPDGKPISFFSRDQGADAIVTELQRWVR
jgi:protein SCO1